MAGVLNQAAERDVSEQNSDEATLVPIQAAEKSGAKQEGVARKQNCLVLSSAH